VRGALAVLGVLITAGLAWGYWQARTHGALHVALYDVALKNERQLYATLRTAASRDGAGMDAWHRCFGIQSRWFPAWVRRVRYAEVKTGECRVERTPVTLEESRDAWWLWWVPHPHIGGSPYTSFTLALWIDSHACRAASYSSRAPIIE
jgi:hypothetical protein